MDTEQIFRGGKSVQICTKCNSESADTAEKCAKCGANLAEFSATAVALRSFQENDRVNKVVVITHPDCCPACQEHQGIYLKDRAPKLPVEGCSHENGCRCFYQPMLDSIFP
jgi:hypothetical protein